MTRRAVRAAGLLAAGMTTVGYASLVERQAYVLRRVTVPCLPTGGAPLRVLHLSDLHITAGQRRKARWVGALARLRPDLVVHTGDTLAGAGAVPRALEALGPLLAFPGAFVLGSNDYYGPTPKNPLRYLRKQHRRVLGTDLPWRSLVAGLTHAGWVDLDNARAPLHVGDRVLDAAGLDDPHLHRERVDEVLGAPPSADASLRLGVVHSPEPRVLDRLVGDGVALVLAGHTHGGQLRVPGYGAIVTNCGLDRARSRGLSTYGAGGRTAWLHVSAGLGTSPYAPYRLACRPEATLLTLTARR